ncbi:MAG TPA: hypothetical protein VII98_08115 [Solirubrobacteraceae bacterium]
MIENGQVWASGGRTVVVLAQEDAHVIVRDSYGWRRSLTEDELEHGFSHSTDQVEAVRGVMARRALADIQPA